ncbi:hypothetical protein [Janthinobacterium psychrotolerans]|nr:hypothetical protein [Janthinobacterium psychrotolerans]
MTIAFLGRMISNWQRIATLLMPVGNEPAMRQLNGKLEVAHDDGKANMLP